MSPSSQRNYATEPAHQPQAVSQTPPIPVVLILRQGDGWYVKLVTADHDVVLTESFMTKLDAVEAARQVFPRFPIAERPESDR